MRKPTKAFILAFALASLGALAMAWALLVTSPVTKVTTSGAATIGGPFTLVSTSGETVTDETYRGKWLLIFFGFTFCPDACPTTLNNMSVALDKLGSEASKLQPLFVTVDPQRDTRDVMAEYLRSFHPAIVGLTGSQEQIDNVVKEYRVYVAMQKTERDENYMVAHSSYVYLVNAQGKFVDVIHGTTAGEEIAAWLRKQLAPSWFLWSRLTARGG